MILRIVVLAGALLLGAAAQAQPETPATRAAGPTAETCEPQPRCRVAFDLDLRPNAPTTPGIRDKGMFRQDDRLLLNSSPPAGRF